MTLLPSRPLPILIVSVCSDDEQRLFAFPLRSGDMAAVVLDPTILTVSLHQKISSVLDAVPLL